jgi:hypothetical protein
MAIGARAAKDSCWGRFLKKRIYPFLRHAVEQTGPVGAFWGSDPAFDDAVESSSALVAEERALPRSLPEV